MVVVLYYLNYLNLLPKLSKPYWYWFQNLKNVSVTPHTAFHNNFYKRRWLHRSAIRYYLSTSL